MHSRPLSDQAVRALHLMLKGGRIVAERTYPHPHHLWLVKPDGLRYKSELPGKALSELVEQGLVAADVKDPVKPDTITYRITEAGTDAAIRGGEPAPATDVLEMFSDDEMGRPPKPGVAA